MPDADYFHTLARRCRTLARAAIAPEIKEQLSLWAVEFADRADEVERHVAKREPAALLAWSPITNSDPGD